MNLLDIGDKMSEKLILAKAKANEITDSGACGGAVSRSEERRVGKECRL